MGIISPQDNNVANLYIGSLGVLDFGSANVVFTHSAATLTVTGMTTFKFPATMALDWGAGDVTLTGGTNTLTLAGGQLKIPDGSSSLPGLQFASGSGLYDSSGTMLFSISSIGTFWVRSGQVEIVSTAPLAWGLDVGADLFLTREAAAIAQWGQDSATPITQAVKGPDARAGTDTNTVGGRINWRTGLSTGNAVPAVQSLQGGAATVTSGTGAQTIVDRFIPNAFKVLTDASATTLVNATIANGSAVGGVIDYVIEATDGTDYQVEVGRAYYSSQNKAGTVGGTITEVSSQQNVSAGTLATTWAISNANPAVISLNADTSLVPSTGYPRITFSIQNLGQQAIAIQ